MGTGTSLEEFRGVCASCDAQGCQKEYMGSKRSQDICHGQPTVIKTFMGSPSFFHGLRCTSRFSIFKRTTPRNHHGWLTENKSALGRRVPKCWALLDFSAARRHAEQVGAVVGLAALQPRLHASQRSIDVRLKPTGMLGLERVAALDRLFVSAPMSAA